MLQIYLRNNSMHDINSAQFLSFIKYNVTRYSYKLYNQCARTRTIVIDLLL